MARQSFKYTINGVCYTQTPIVLGQAIQLAKNINGMSDSIDGDSLGSLIETLGASLPMLMAIVLNPEGVAPQDKDIDELATILEANAELEIVEQVVSDFFICNPLTKMLENLETATGVIGRAMAKLMLKFYSTMYASSWQEGISPSEILSSGDIPVPK